MMWTRQQRPPSCNAITSSLLPTSDPPPLWSKAVFEPHLWATERRTVSLLVPNGLLKPEETGTEEEGLLPPMRRDPLTGTAFPSRGTMLPAGAVDGTSSDAPAQALWPFFLYLAPTQTQMIDVKFHNQLHFKSYMHIPGRDETLLCEGPDMIPVHVDSNAFHLQWFQIFTNGDPNSGQSACLVQSSPTRHRQTMRCKILFKKWNGTIQFISF